MLIIVEARRKAWIAGLFSVFVPGLGQLYNGQAKKGLLFYSTFWLSFLLYPVIIMITPIAPVNVIIAVGAWPILYLIILVDSVRSARKPGTNYKLKNYNQWYVYILYVLAIYLTSVALILASLMSQKLVASNYKVLAASMLPSLWPGDEVLVDKFIYRFKEPVRGDIVLFEVELQGGDFEVRSNFKRIVGLPRDVVEIKKGAVYINKRPLKESYLKQPTTGHFGPLIVPANQVFVMGDNRASSKDSRYIGPIKISNVKGKVRVITWSRQGWARIGRQVR